MYIYYIKNHYDLLHSIYFIFNSLKQYSFINFLFLCFDHIHSLPNSSQGYPTSRTYSDLFSAPHTVHLNSLNILGCGAWGYTLKENWLTLTQQLWDTKSSSAAGGDRSSASSYWSNWVSCDSEVFMGRCADMYYVCPALS